MRQVKEKVISNNTILGNVKNTISGIWLVVEDTAWNILLVLENYNKPWKKAWQFSIIFWEIEEWESPFDALKRELPEETSLEVDKDIPLDNIKRKWCIHVNCENDEKCIEVKATIFYVKVNPTILEKIKKFKNWEIKEIHLAKLEEIKEMVYDKLRPWTIEAIYTAKNWDYPVVVNLKNWWYMQSYLKILKIFLEEMKGDVFS